MKIEELKKYKKILILGYGIEGRSTEKFLKKYCPDSTIDITDKKTDTNYLDSQKNFDLIIRSPGIPKKLVKNPYTTATNIFFANTNNVVIGITGTKGKSTTASLIYSIIKNSGRKVRLIGNIGKPMLEELMLLIDQKIIFVCELSSYQLDDIKYSPQISVVLDVYPEHMNYHDNISNYYNAKKNIINYCKNSDYFIYNPKFDLLRNWAKNVKCFTLPFEQITILDKDTSLIGEHNKDNIRGAITVAHLLKIEEDYIWKTIKTFKPLAHRMQLIGNYKNVIFYDDAISTTPESTIFAIESLKKVGTIFLGGQDRGYQFEKLIESINKYEIDNLILFPDSGNKILEIIKSKNLIKNFRILKTESMEEAVLFAYKNTPTGKICLLSCASPSYSLWKNFEEKGDLFQKYVKKYS